METIYVDIDKKGKAIYYTYARRAGRYIRMSSDEAVLAIATGQAASAVYLPNKPYEEFTTRQLFAAREMFQDAASAKMIGAEIAKRTKE